MFIDTHSHLYLGRLAKNIPEAIENLRENNFSHTIQIGTSVETSKTCLNLAKEYEIVRATVWIHPCEAQDMSETRISEEIEKLESLILTTRKNPETAHHLVGLGEIGFDEYHLSDDLEEAEKQKIRQNLWFHAQADLAKKYDLPVVIHTRNCPGKTLEELTKSGLQKFVIHCFSEDWGFASKILEMSPETMISFTGILTFPQSTQVREVAKKTPLDRIMIETDAPYIIPQQMKWKVSYCEPSFSRYVFESLCELRDESCEEIEQQIYENSVKFFGLSPVIPVHQVG